MDEILYELREHAAGLNAGRWDYLFSGIKKLRTWPELAVPDRAQLTMTVPFMRAYTELLVRTCHRRGAHAIGGMAAFIPNRRDPAVTEVALAKVRDDKEREIRRRLRRDVGRPSRPRAGGDRGLRPGARRSAEPEGPAARGGVGRRRGAARPARPGRGRHRGRGPGERPGRAGLSRLVAARCRGGRHRQPDGGRRDRRDLALAAVALADSRRSALADGRRFDAALYAAIRDEELARLGGAGEGRLAEATDLLDRLVLDDDFAEFLTLRAYALLD